MKSRVKAWRSTIVPGAYNGGRSEDDTNTGKEPAVAQVEVGDEAPDFALHGAHGEETRLRDLRGVKRALLIFYPKDATSG